jgi:chaperonin GroES
MQLKPLHDRVVVRLIEADAVTESGIVIPDTSKEKPTQGEVIAVGPGKYENGKLIPTTVKPGDRILFGKEAVQSFKIDDETFHILHEVSIMSKVTLKD